MAVGIELYTDLVYEGDTGRGHAVWPNPVITPANMQFPEDEPYCGGKTIRDDPFGWIFREDSFDPISRVKRGRFYKGDGIQPAGWVVYFHPARDHSRASSSLCENKSLHTFYPRSLSITHYRDHKRFPLVHLEVGDRFTTWEVIHVEEVISGEELVTLKARSTFGVLPELDSEKIPEANRNAIVEHAQKFVDEVHRASPASVVDRARDLASDCLLVFYQRGPENAKYLGPMIKELEKESRVIAANAATIIARLHARAKPVERKKRGLRLVTERDASLAVSCVGTLLSELGWAK